MYHILVVDDNKTNLTLAKCELSDEYQVTPVISGQQALQFLEKKTPDLIMLDLIMPEMDGKETMRRIKENPEWSKIPIIFLTADSTAETESECLKLGADDFVAKPFVPEVMKSRIARLIELKTLRYDLESRLEEKTRELEKVTLNSIMMIAKAIEAKDEYTCGHSTRVAQCAEELAKRLGWDENECLNLRYVALLHDIGKIGVPDSVLNKPSRLTDEEFAIIKKHPVTGGNILKDIKILPYADEGALYHHERYDGKGYPHGLKGEEIPLYARLICIADSYDAMTSNRVYRRKLSNDYVISEFERCAGSQFDPELAKVFVEMLKEGFSIETNDLESLSHEEHIPVANENTDPLTGLLTLDAGIKHLDQLLNSSRKGTLLLLGPDNLGLVNDLMGHVAGDKLLTTCSKKLVAKAGAEDILMRTGGDELGIFLVDNTDRNAVKEFAKEIIDEIKAETESNYSVRVNVSAGAFDSGRNSTDYLACAGKALYLAAKTEPGSCFFYERVGKSSAVERTETDIEHLCGMIEGGMDTAPGAYTVDYEEFRRIYTYISRSVGRAHKTVEVLLFTLKSFDGSVPNNTTLETAVNALSSSITGSLRSADVSTKYSSSQFIVILPDADGENSKIVAQRIAERFYKIYPNKDTELLYDLRSMQVNRNK